jgi:5-hydroxyisourate hydrolase-like protein (transthyretin family)
MSKQQFYVSNIGYVKNGNDIFVLNRETGLPLNNVEVKVYKDEWVSTKNISIKKLIETKRTNKNGFFQLATKENYYNYYFHFIGNKDELKMNSNEYYYGRYNNTEDDDDGYKKMNGKNMKKTKQKFSFYRSSHLQTRANYLL